MNAPPALEMNGATVVRGGRRIVDDLSLRIERGGHTAILGPNGSGKTTLIRLITREYYPLGGSEYPPKVAVFGRAIWDLFELRSHMGIIASDVDRDFALGDAAGLEVALSGFFSSRGVYSHHMVTAEMVAAARQALALMGVGCFEEKPVSEMSTGEIRRVMIARALAPNPEALLLDEPTAGLDPVARRGFLETLRRVARAGKTIILVTHHVEEVLPEIEQIVLMRGGRIVRAGPKADLLRPDILSDLFGAAMAVAENNGYYSANVL
jgi:iron complex transport system ATP-binding protein